VIPEDLPLDLVLAIAGAALVVVAGLVGLWALRRHRARRALLGRIEAVAADYLRDVVLDDGAGGWIHVDFLLLTGRGIVVLDLRDLPGLIFGSEQMTEWTVMHKSRRYTFPNPLGPLYDRIAAVRALVGEAVPVEGLVVFTDRGSFPKGHPRAATRLASLSAEIPPLGVAGRDEHLARWRPSWDAVRAAATPSPLRRR
jgi:hypothetical protein